MNKKHSPTQKAVRNIFPITQIKKMMGKKLIIPWKYIPITATLKDNIKKLKELIITASPEKQKNIIIIGVCINGIINIIGGVDRLIAISSISYDEIKKYNLSNLNITIMQYSSISQTEIKRLAAVHNK